jgi:hypothetical protein
MAEGGAAESSKYEIGEPRRSPKQNTAIARETSY